MISASPTDHSERPRPGHPISRSLKPLSNQSSARQSSLVAPTSQPSKQPAAGLSQAHGNPGSAASPHDQSLKSYDSNRDKIRMKHAHQPQLHELPKLQPSVAKIKSKVLRQPDQDGPPQRVKAFKQNVNAVQDENSRAAGVANAGHTSAGVYHHSHDSRQKPSSGATSPVMTMPRPTVDRPPSSGFIHRDRQMKQQQAPSQKMQKRLATSPTGAAHDHDSHMHPSRMLGLDGPKPGSMTASRMSFPKDGETKPKPYYPSADSNGLASSARPFQGQRKKVDRFGASRLARRAEKGLLSLVEDAYDMSPSELDQLDNAGVAPLQKAACQGHANVVRFLVDKGCRLNTMDHDGDTPLIDAVANSHVPVVKLLLRTGVNPHHANRHGRRAIDHLPSREDCEGVHNELREILWDAMQAWTAAHVDSTEPEPEDVGPVEEKPLNRPDLLYIDYTLANLRKFAAQGDAVAVNHILTLITPDVSCAVAAARGGHSDILSFLLATMDPSDKDPDPQKCTETPLLAAIGRGHLDVLELVLNQDNFNPTRRTKDGKTYWQVAEERRGPKWASEVQLLKRRFDEYEQVKLSGSKKRSAIPESTEEAVRPVKLPRTSTDRTVSGVSLKPKSVQRPPPPVPEKISPTVDGDRPAARPSKNPKYSNSKENREKLSSKSASPQPSNKDYSIPRRRRVVDDEDDDDEGSLSDRQPVVADKHATTPRPPLPSLSKPLKAAKMAKQGEPKKVVRQEKADSVGPVRAIKRERMNSLSEPAKPKVVTLQESRDTSFSGRRLSKSSPDKDKAEGLRPRPAVGRDPKVQPPVLVREKPEKPKPKPTVDQITIEERDILTREIRERVEREERSRIAREERERVFQEERVHTLREEKLTLEKEKAELEREALEQAQRQEERERIESEQKLEQERLRKEAEDAESRLAEAAELARRAADDKAAKAREQFIGSLPLALSEAIRHGPDRSLRASGLNLGVVDLFLPLWTVPLRSICADVSPSRQNDRWLMSWQAVGLLGLAELDLAAPTSGVSHWERMPVTEEQMVEWMKFYSGHQLAATTVAWPEDADYDSCVVAAREEAAHGWLRREWSDFFWVRLADVMAEVDRRDDLRSLCIGHVDDGCFVSPDGTGYGGRYVEGHAAFGYDSSASSIRQLIFSSHGLPCPQPKL